MASLELHELVKQGKLTLVQAYLADPTRKQENDVNAYDPAGYTPLMHAVKNPNATVELVRTLLENGADIHQATCSEYGAGCNVMAPAVPDESSSGTASVPRCGVTSGYFFGLGLGLGEATGTSSKKVTL